MKPGRNIFVLTGAGISAESGIPVFQGTSWRGYSHYELANIEAWRRDPRLVWEYYSERRLRARDALPNPAHRALARLEKAGALDRWFLCTQNVDGLHEAAGSGDVVHIHGKLFESRCAAGCGEPVFEDRAAVVIPEDLPHCACGSLVRPNVCWFGEPPFHLDRISRELELCNVFLAIGTSGSVHPAAGFAAFLKRRLHPARTLYIGMEEPANAWYFDEIHLGQASALAAPLLDKLAGAQGFGQ